MEITDNVIPASNSVMANNLFELSVLLDDAVMKAKAVQMVKNSKLQSLKSPSYSYNWLSLMQKINSVKQEIVIVGKDANQKRTELLKDYYPLVIISGSEVKNENRPLLENRYQEGITLFYYCVDNACQMPVEKVEKLKLMINK